MNVFPKFSGVVPTDDRSVLDALRGSDIVKKAFTERSTSVLAYRKAAAEKHVKLQSDATAHFPKLRFALEEALRVAKAAEIASREAADRAYSIQAQLSSDHSIFTNELAKLESQLAESASPEILPFIADMWALWEDALKQYEFHHSIETVNILGKKVSVTQNNKSSVMARREAIRDAITAAEAMRLEPDQATVPERLQQLRQSLPTIKGA